MYSLNGMLKAGEAKDVKRKAISVILTVLLLSAVFIQSTHANSAQRHWSGTDSTGSLIKRQELPARGG